MRQVRQHAAGETACLLLHGCYFRMRSHSCQHAAYSPFLRNLRAVGGVLVCQITETHARLLLHRCRVCVRRHRREKLFDAPAAGVGVTKELIYLRITYIPTYMHTYTRMYIHAYV